MLRQAQPEEQSLLREKLIQFTRDATTDEQAGILPPTGPAGGVGYVCGRFPVLTETFILNEILALEARGVPVHIFSLDRPKDSRFHEDLSRLKARVRHLPATVDHRLLRHHQRLARRERTGYTQALGYALANDTGELFWRFLQGGYIANRARRLRLHHLHAHFARRATDAAFFASMMSGIPYSFTAHAYDIYRADINTQTLAERIRQAKFVVTVSDFNKAYLKRLAGDAPEKILRIYNGIDLDRFVPHATPPGAPFTILCVARLVEKKGLALLVEACRHLRERGHTFRCWIVGTGGLGPQLEELLARWRLCEHVSLLGPHTQREVLERYHAAHLFVLPCLVGADGNRDGLPVSMVEALACGLPVITTPITGIPEVLRHRHNGLLVPDKDPQALADAIEAVIRDPQLYRHLQAHARASVTATFDLRQTAATLHRLFGEGRL